MSPTDAPDNTPFVCTAARPWRRISDGMPAIHPDARELGDQRDGWPGGDLVTMRCPHCGVSWEKELPQ